jgi:hypothetical protein
MWEKERRERRRRREQNRDGRGDIWGENKFT